MALKEQITEITLDCMLGIRAGVGQCRVEEFNSYLNALIMAKEAGIDPETLQWPMLSDRVKQLVDAALSAKTNKNVSGGLEWHFIRLGGSYDDESSEGLRLQVEMEFKSSGAPDFELIRAMSVEEIKKLQSVVTSIGE